MERLSTILAVCLLAGLSECQTGGEDNQNEITELTHEELADTWVEKDALQNLETPMILPTTSTATQPSCDPTIYTVLKELGALEEKLSANERALEEKLSADERALEEKLSANERAQEEKLSATVRALEEKLSANERALEETNKKLTVLEKSAEEKGRLRIAFSASLATDDTIGPVNFLHALVYNRVLSNIGGHYSPVTGYFTAPVRGVYYFTFSSHWWGGDGTSAGSLYHNGNRRVSWHGQSPHYRVSGSNSAILLLEVGDNVNVRLWENRKISNNVNDYSTFSGFLLFPV